MHAWVPALHVAWLVLSVSRCCLTWWGYTFQGSRSTSLSGEPWRKLTWIRTMSSPSRSSKGWRLIWCHFFYLKCFPISISPFFIFMSLLHTLITLFPSLFFSCYIFFYPCSSLSLHPNSLQVLDNPDIANKLSIQFSIWLTLLHWLPLCTFSFHESYIHESMYIAIVNVFKVYV